MRIALYAAIVVEHTCVCGVTVDSYGTHGLSFQRSGDCLSHHVSVNETIHHALVSDGVATSWQLFLNPLGFIVMMVNNLMVAMS